MPRRQSFYVTSPIYYVNDKPHIGHAYTTLACDVLARFKRLDGYDVKFLTGTDEHGQKVEKSATAAGKAPLAFCDEVSANFRALAKALNASNDDFIRTTEPRHYKSCQAIWQAMQAKGDIYLGSYAGWYAVRDEAFYGEEELTKGADGKFVAPSGAPVEWVEEPSYFFRLSAWKERLLAHYEANPDFILPESRRNEVVSFVKGELRDLSISRTSFTWGVPVPGDPAHIMYVWLDALTNYISALDYPDTNGDKYRRFWPADLHLVGKDILRFHAVYWPAFLMSAGLAPPRRIFAHGWWTIEGQKMSKSLGNAIDPHQIIATFGLDQTRYFLMREVPFGNDGDFSRRAMVQRINADLANDFGNLVQRVLSMINKNCAGAVPKPGRFFQPDDDLLARSFLLLEELRADFDRQAIHVALGRIWDLVGQANRYVDEMAPWSLRKSDPARMATVLYVLAEVIRRLAILVQPVVPAAAARILDQLAVPAGARDFSHVHVVAELKPGTPLPKPEGVFPRFVESEAGAS
ncbi:MAG TPA: methionine--tRNA ligase [Candidatus Sulfotelmatobacter sp.]|nr:methionine--tRNA ligase [Candidatus Sulfotelmatobacter sp.]